MTKDLTPLKALEHLAVFGVYGSENQKTNYDIIEKALLKYEKLCKVINHIYEIAHGEVKYKFDSVSLAYFADKLKQVIDEDKQ